MRRVVSLAVLALILLAPAPLLGGASGGDEGLLAGLAPLDGRGIYRPDRITDGRADRDGGDWSSAASAVFESPRAFAIWGLPEPGPVAAIRLQADADDRYVVEASSDGARWALLARGEAVPGGEGMATRELTLERPVEVAWVRLRAEGGDGRYGVGELQLFGASQPAGPSWKRVEPRPTPDRSEQLRRYATWKLALAGLALLLGFGLLRRPEEESTRPGLRRAALVAIAACGALAWTHFGAFNDGWSVHNHDAFHYLLGARYAAELGYDGLYDCAVAAEAERPWWPVEPESVVRDLTDDRPGIWREALARGEACRARFEPARWAAFVDDVRLFQSRLTPAAWRAVLADHGYNAPPVWSAVYGTIAGPPPSSSGTLSALSAVDPLLYALGFFALGAAFGLEVAALALLLFGLGFPWTCLWTAGGIGRATWLAACLVGLALTRSSRPIAGGIGFGFAASLRVFPGALLLGPMAALARGLRREGGPGDRSGRLLAGAALALAVAGVASTVALGPDLWLDFAANTGKHVSEGGGNKMGLEVLLSGLLGTGSGAQVVLRVLQLGAVAAVVVVSLRVGRDWERALLGVALIPVLVPVTSYYCVLVVLLAPLLVRDRPMGLAFVVAAAASNLPLLWGMDHLDPRYYQVASAVLLLLLAAVVARVPRFCGVEPTGGGAPDPG